MKILIENSKIKIDIKIKAKNLFGKKQKCGKENRKVKVLRQTNNN